jgi:hypothetical protein
VEESHHGLIGFGFGHVGHWSCWDELFCD